MARRPSRRQTVDIPSDLTALAERCEYVGSTEHKDQRSWLGLPRPRRRPRDVATIRPLVTERDRAQATNWVRSAIVQGNFDRTGWRNGFPRKIWYRHSDGQVWYGSLTNQGAGTSPVGQYKGWPLDEDERRAIFG